MELNDATIYKISFAITVIGIGLLFFSSINSVIEVKQLDESLLNQRVSVQGITEKSYQKNKVLIFWLYSNESIKCVLFNPSQKEIELTKNNSFVQISGVVKEYERELEIVVEQLQELT